MKKILFTASAILFASIAFASEHEIVQKDKAFFLKTPDGALKPVRELSIKKGDKISFKNEDKIVHNIYATGDVDKFEVPKQDPGSSDIVNFDKDGKARVTCAIHPRMKLNVKIE